MTWQHHPFQPQVPPSPLLNHPGDHSSDDQANGEVSPNFLLQFLKSGGVDEPRNGGEVRRHQVQAPVPVQDWQLQDPAVAAHGPSHNFPLAPGEAPPPGMYSPAPPPLPPYAAGWSPFHQQQERLFPENPFLTPTDHGFIRPFALQVERPFHPHAPPFPLPYPAVTERPPGDGYRLLHEQHNVVSPGTPQLFVPGVMDLSDNNKRVLEQQQWQITQSTVEGLLMDDTKGGQHFFGTGAELLQLLQGGPARAKAEGVMENGESASKTPQRGSPSTLHGPIGPPRRQIISPPQSPNDLLGRMWAALPPSSQGPYVGQDGFTPVHDYVLEEAADQVLDTRFADDAYRFEPDMREGPGFSLLKRGGTSKMPLNGFECQESKSIEKQMANSSCSSTPGRSPEYQRGREHEYAEESRANGRRRGSVSRRIGGRGGAVGQWVAINDKNKETDSGENSSNDIVDTKDEGPKANGFHREEMKRKKKLQQEWRIKCPQVDSKLNHLSDKRQDYRLKARPLASQLEYPGLPSGSTQGSSVGAALEDSKQRLYNRLDPDALDDEEVTSCMASLDLDDQESENVQREWKPEYHKPKELRGRESRRHIHVHRRDMFSRPDLQKFTRQLLGLYNELIPTEEEEARRRKCLSKLEALVDRELPGARLFLFGSCANAFGVRNSDIDICLNVDEEEPNKVELVMQIAAILEADNMLNVQALTHARVPIVKFTEPETGISCDICVNNMLAVVNSKLLHDYSRIDVRLRQLAFMVKHWAKRRQVNETYRGTLSSYAYVLMCIHFLQQRRPAILPCLQEMPPTYEVKVGHIRCSYYDHVEKLRDFGADNKETLGELLTAFFDYWAYGHNYNHAVISVRTGGYMSKDEKEWTRRIGNERHLICIEDPFETSHDLGRVVDKHSIKALRGEFYRAANTIASDFNPCVTLFEPYVRQSQKPSSAEDH